MTTASVLHRPAVRPFAPDRALTRTPEGYPVTVMEIPTPASVFAKGSPVPAVSETVAEVVTISPGMAVEMLERNAHNRPLKERIVAAYARDMRRGNWRMTGEAIKFDTNGDLADGQHRLAAIVKAKVPVTLLVVWGVPPEAQQVMDSGVKRSVNDNLTLNGVKNSSILTAAARLALTEPAAGFIAATDRVASPTNSELLDFIEAHPDIHRAADVARGHYPAIDCQPSVLCLAWMRFSQIDLEACAIFFHSVANMTTDGPGDPRLALARRLQNLRREGTRRSGPMLLGLVYRSWNGWRRGKQLSTLPIPASIPERLY